MSARVTQHIIEALVPVIARSPATPTGAGVTQHIVEAIVLPSPQVRLTSHFVEVLVSAANDGTQPDPPAGGSTGTTVYGFAV